MYFNIDWETRKRSKGGGGLGMGWDGGNLNFKFGNFFYFIVSETFLCDDSIYIYIYNTTYTTLVIQVFLWIYTNCIHTHAYTHTQMHMYINIHINNKHNYVFYKIISISSTWYNTNPFIIEIDQSNKWSNKPEPLLWCEWKH